MLQNALKRGGIIIACIFLLSSRCFYLARPTLSQDSALTHPLNVVCFLLLSRVINLALSLDNVEISRWRICLACNLRVGVSKKQFGVYMNFFINESVCYEKINMAQVP